MIDLLAALPDPTPAAIKAARSTLTQAQAGALNGAQRTVRTLPSVIQTSKFAGTGGTR